MVDVEQFYNTLLAHSMDFFTGVPDSLLKNFCSIVQEKSGKGHHILAANEGNAIGLAAGYHLSTGKIGVVYMQNSGLGNTVNPLLSLADEEVYSIPMLLIIGWRGEPGVKDEPQHKKQGKVTLDLLDAMQIPYEILSDDYLSTLKKAEDYFAKNSKPFAIVVKKNTFSSYPYHIAPSSDTMTREEAIEAIVNELDENDMIVSTTGKTSRELFEIREKKQESHGNDFLTVGSMGHTSSIACGVSLGTDKNVFCLDGDGSLIMHLGALPIVLANSKENFKYIVNANGAHESVGGQPTIVPQIDLPSLLKACGAKHVHVAHTPSEIATSIQQMKKESATVLILHTKQGSRDDLGRPTKTPIENKEAFMETIKK